MESLLLLLLPLLFAFFRGLGFQVENFYLGVSPLLVEELVIGEEVASGDEEAST
jgi:hypothetical protein